MYGTGVGQDKERAGLLLLKGCELRDGYPLYSASLRPLKGYVSVSVSLSLSIYIYIDR
jgi:hypothetical protein